ncbi:hypothetical protein [Alkalicoccobacillus plakortidis]|uniref:Uncharacterized protein n=1 Tax=Alkalicoccobacillus plakortidis TaxID=444060 RepID=A0ABT0XJ36_9BACI|nr:hypothetical protein [Alkalicoccobacillus plakortidis]MCM2675916.1 hypothetical protein [Alkalicoccobacillus plakortidis]
MREIQKNILFFDHQVAIGGGEKSLLLLVDNLPESINIFMVYTGEGEFYKELKKEKT